MYLYMYAICKDYYGDSHLTRRKKILQKQFIIAQFTNSHLVHLSLNIKYTSARTTK